MFRICAQSFSRHGFERAQTAENHLRRSISNPAKRAAAHNLRNMTE
jgi:hypothetical protein